MTPMIRVPCLLVFLTYSLTLAVASPTANEYASCHQQAAKALSSCLDRNPGSVSDNCWTESRRANATCYASVRESHRPDMARIAAAKKAAACTQAGGLMLWAGTRDVASGSQMQAAVLRSHRPGMIEDVPSGCIDAWEIDSTPHAMIDQSGLVRIDAGTPDGTLIMVTALMGETRIGGQLRAYDVRRHLLKGNWKQVSERTCDSAVERAPTEPIRELQFDAGGKFSVTLRPFELYQDYRGDYRHDAASGAVVFSNASGNKVPSGLRLQGTAKVTGEELVLNDIVLWPAADGAPLCRLRFAR
jgi:hypothetical protein